MKLLISSVLLLLPSPVASEAPAPAAAPWAIQFSGPVAETAKLLVCLRTGPTMLECQDLLPFLQQHDANQQQEDAIERRKQLLTRSWTEVSL